MTGEHYAFGSGNPLKDTLHLTRCLVELGRFAIRELVWNIDESVDCWGPDSPEDAAIPSNIGQRELAA